jgi:hypothetical protein
MSLESDLPAAPVQSRSRDQAGSTSTAVIPTRRFIRQALLFTAVGLLLYLLVYAAADGLVYQTAKRNRFFAIKTAAHSGYDYVILGASHAAALDYEDMTAQLEKRTGSKILNLSVVGGGIVVNGLLLEYFLAGHRTAAVVYVLDSFAFYSRQWNEDRLNDTKLFDRAPFDPALVQVLLQDPAGRPAAADYVSGFSKINNPDRFKSDIGDDEATKFNKTYRPVKQIDQQRMEYLYPNHVDAETFRHYVGEFEELLRYLEQHNIRLIVVKPPIPARVYAMLPDEAAFDRTLQPVLARHNVEFHDFSLVGNDEKFFFNTDHLNRTGVLNFFDQSLKDVLALSPQVSK